MNTIKTPTENRKKPRAETRKTIEETTFVTETESSPKKEAKESRNLTLHQENQKERSGQEKFMTYTCIIYLIISKISDPSLCFYC